MVINVSIGKVKNINWLFILGICGTTALWLNRLNLGAANYDEIFYLTLPYRLTLGDTLIFDEWSTPQLTGFILWPIMSIYKFFFSSNWNGVALNFRYIWLLFHQVTSLVAYLFLKKHYHGWSAACAAILYSAFVPFGIMALSYNSIGLATAFLLSILFSEEYTSTPFDVLKGFLLSILVLCNPYCIFFYFLFWLLAITEKAKCINRQFSGRHMLGIHIGIAIMLIPFIIHFFTNMNNIGQLGQCLANILRDPAHPPKSMLVSIIGQMNWFVSNYLLFVLAYLFFFIIGYLKPEKRNFCLGILLFLCGLTSLYDALYHNTEYGMNTCVLFLSFSTWAAFCFKNIHCSRCLLWRCFLPLIYSVCMTASSNVGFYVIADACFIGTCWAPIMIKDYLVETQISFAWKNISSYRFGLPTAIILSILIQLSSSAYVQMHHIFWEENVSELNAKISKGPLTGIQTTYAKKEKYERLFENMDSLDIYSESSVLIYPMLPIGYFELGCEVAAPSTWFTTSGLEDDRLLSYFELNPSKVPQWILIFYEDPISGSSWIIDDSQISRLQNNNYSYEIATKSDQYVLLQLSD